MDSPVIEDRGELPVIPGYELLEQIGEGGMGRVHRARDLRRQCLVAIKLLSFASQPPGRSRRDFQREARLMATVCHPNVVAMLDCGSVNDTYYVVMEHVDGPSLRSLLTPGQWLPIQVTAPLVDRVAMALVGIHQQGVLHLDLKPENILLDCRSRIPDELNGSISSLAHLESGNPKIADFGLAALWRDQVGGIDPALACGSIDYCPPEQRFGLPVDQRSDLFSLATIAYELYTGHLPGRVYVPASQRNPQLPTTIDEVLARALARDPDERQASVEEFRQQLARS